jgi:hypothetical protein
VKLKDKWTATHRWRWGRLVVRYGGSRVGVVDRVGLGGSPTKPSRGGADLTKLGPIALVGLGW